MSDVRAVAFLVLCTAIGYDLAIAEIYGWWFTDQILQASSKVLGIAVACSSALDIIMYILSGVVINRFKTNKVMCVGLSILSVSNSFAFSFYQIMHVIKNIDCITNVMSRPY